MGWDSWAATGGEVLTGLVLIVGLIGSLMAFTKTERLTRRLRSHTEVLAALPSGSANDLMQEIVDQDVRDLHGRLCEDPASAERRWAKWERRGGLTVLVLLATGALVTWTTDVNALEIIQFPLMAVFFFLAYATARQTKAQSIKRKAGGSASPRKRLPQ